MQYCPRDSSGRISYDYISSITTEKDINILKICFQIYFADYKSLLTYHNSCVLWDPHWEFCSCPSKQVKDFRAHLHYFEEFLTAPKGLMYSPQKYSPSWCNCCLGRIWFRGTVMQKGSGEKSVGVFQEPNQRQQHLDFKTSTPFIKTCQAQSVYCLVCSRLNNPYKHMCLVWFPYLGQVGFPRFLYRRPLWISCGSWT